MRSAAWLLLVALAIISCDKSRLYEDHRDLEKGIWAAADTSTFAFRIEDAGLNYNIYYTIRNSIDYPYARLFTTYAVQDSSGLTLRKDLLTTYLFDQKTGKPFGTTGIGDLFDHRVLLLENYRFSQPGPYSILLNQSMRMDSLPGIFSVGIRLEESKK